MRTRQAFLASLALLIVPTAATAIPPSSMGYAYAQIFQANTTVTLVDITLDVESGGILTGSKCIPFTADSTLFERESNGAGRFTSAGVPLAVGFNHGLQAKLDNTGLGAAPRLPLRGTAAAAGGDTRICAKLCADSHEPSAVGLWGAAITRCFGGSSF